MPEDNLPETINFFNWMHREICGVQDLIRVVDAIDLAFRYQRNWTESRMRREAPVAISCFGLLRDLKDICNNNDWLSEDRAPFLAYKADLLLRAHHSRIGAFDWVTSDTSAPPFDRAICWSSCSSLLNWDNRMRARTVPLEHMMWLPR